MSIVFWVLVVIAIILLLLLITLLFIGSKIHIRLSNKIKQIIMMYNLKKELKASKLLIGRKVITKPFEECYAEFGVIVECHISYYNDAVLFTIETDDAMFHCRREWFDLYNDYKVELL